ncbi:type II secretion system protein [Candidatus Gottesmanbacteria bacterium]|nr:type II secretion system protein [Candidatus Gottesmanbacteria bacterium]
MKSKAFSLIELLVVISIMAILGSLALSAFSTARKEARDTQRKNELTQYKTALESYYVSNSTYPVYSGSPAISNQFQGIFDQNSSFIQIYMAGTTLQGVNAADNYVYYYLSDGVKYKLWGKIELNDYFEICSNGKSGALKSINLNLSSVACDL